MESGKKLDIKEELLRKLIHIGYSIVPLIYLFTDKKTIIIVTAVLSVYMVSLDLARLKFKWIHDLYLKVLGKILRNHEFDNRRAFFTGGTYLVLASLFCFIFFEKHVAISALLITTFGDTFAALAGKSIGRVKFWGKTLEGSIAFFLTGLVVLYFMGMLGGILLIPAIIALVITTVFELLPLPIDDNITIPFSFCFAFNAVNMISGHGCAC
jgi:dolichol kinase